MSDITRPVPGKVLTCCTAPLVKGTMCQSLQGHPGGESCDGTDINIGIDIDVADINEDIVDINMYRDCQQYFAARLFKHAASRGHKWTCSRQTAEERQDLSAVP